MSAETSVDLSQAFILEPIPTGDHLVVMPVLLALFGGAICLMLRRQVNWHPWIAGSVMGAITCVAILLLGRVLHHGPITVTMGKWLPPFGISFTVDAVGALLTLTASCVGFLAVIYASRDIDVIGRRFGFYPLLMLLLAGVSGSFLTGDIFNLYVWFEVMLLSSFGLLILGGEKRQLDGAVKYAFLNLIATTLFLIATGYLYGIIGTLNMADIAIKLRQPPDGAPVMTLAILYFLAFGMKAAAFPVNFWLPASYHTPRIVVSALFAALLTKVGVYALLRTLLMLMPSERLVLSDIILWVAVLTMILGALGALAQSNIRRLLSFLVISGIGSIMVGLGLGNVAAVTGSLLYAVHSILVMCGLYFAVGLIERINNSSDLALVGGIYRQSSLLSACFLILSLAVAGMPPFSGFWPKVILVRASLADGMGWVTAAILLTGLLTTIAVGRVWAHTFWRGGALSTPDGHQNEKIKMISEGHFALLTPVVLITAFIIVIGVFAQPLIVVAMIGAKGLVTGSGVIESVFGGTP